MQVRVFEADSIKEAMEQVKKTLGADALILSTRTVSDSKLGILGKPRHEVTAAVDFAPPAAAVQPARMSGSRRHLLPDEPEYLIPPSQDDTKLAAAAPPAVETPSAGPVGSNAATHLRPSDVYDLQRVFDAQQKIIADKLEELRTSIDVARLLPLKDEMDEIKNLVHTVAREMAAVSEKIPAPANSVPATRQTPEATPATAAKVAAGKLDSRLEMLRPLAQDLKTFGVAPASARLLLQRAEKTMTLAQCKSSGNRRQFLRWAIKDMFAVTGPLAARARLPQRLAFVGPTGVGKTTTMAKLAARHLQQGGANAVLITIDTYCVGAVEQLKLYGGIMKLPVEVVRTPNELAVALASHRDKELVFIDMAGRSPRDIKHLQELGQFFPPEFNIKTHLVLSASTGENHLRSTIDKFSFLNYESVIFTKLDECDSLGTLLNIHAACRMPLSYLTDGQKVPEDIHLATPELLADLVINR